MPCFRPSVSPLVYRNSPQYGSRARAASPAVVRGAYAPSEAAVAEASALLQAAAAAGSGVFQYNGKMIDGPILKHAESIIRRAGEQA